MWRFILGWLITMIFFGTLGYYGIVQLNGLTGILHGCIGLVVGYIFMTMADNRRYRKR